MDIQKPLQSMSWNNQLWTTQKDRWGSNITNWKSTPPILTCLKPDRTLCGFQITDLFHIHKWHTFYTSRNPLCTSRNMLSGNHWLVLVGRATNSQLCFNSSHAIQLLNGKGSTKCFLSVSFFFFFKVEGTVLWFCFSEERHVITDQCLNMRC